MNQVKQDMFHIMFSHYAFVTLKYFENLPMQYTEIFSVQKLKISFEKN